MIDKEKVVIMTKAAMEETRSGKKKRPAVDYFPEDYVGLQVIKGLIGISVLYVLAAGAWALYTAESWLASYSYADLFELGKKFLLLYVIVMAMSAVILVMVYALRYYRARAMVKEEAHQLRRLCKYYEKTEGDA